MAIPPPPPTVLSGRTGPEEPEWQSVMQRCVELAPMLASLRLKNTASKAAAVMGLDGPMALNRELQRRRLPPFGLMRDWCYVVKLVDRFGVDRSLANWALHRGEYPAVYYQFVRRVTGLTWRELLNRGTEWAQHRALAVWAPYLAKDEFQ